MGTKNNPDQFDCYAKAAPDEPIFTLRAKDFSAPYFVTMWSLVRQGRWDEALETFVFLMQDHDVQETHWRLREVSRSGGRGP